jgi:hypothetical protein
MVASDSFAEFLREQLAPLGRVTMRRMFGKTGVFCNGLMFGMAGGLQGSRVLCAAKRGRTAARRKSKP